MGKPAARITDMHVCPMFDGPKPHVGGPIVGPGCPTVLIGGMPAAVMGDMVTCVGPPDTIILGSVGVMIGGKPAARMGDMCAHGGSIVLGCPTVLIGEIMPGAVSGGAIGLAGMSINVLLEVMKTMPKEMKTKMAQIITMKQAALDGTPFCEKCAEAMLQG